MKIPGIGELFKDDRYGEYYSAPLSLSILNGQECRIVVEGYEEDPAKEDFNIAIANFISSPYSVLTDAENYIFEYYQDINSNLKSTDDEFLLIESPCQIWKHIQLGNEPVVSRRPYGDKGIYISLECNCDWEPEHGLQIVFKNGSKVTKIGPFDGHLTNSDAFANPNLENVVYR